MFKVQLLFVTIFSIALMGCAVKTPDCNDSKTLDLAISIEKDTLKGTFDTMGEFFKQLAESQGMTLDNNFGSIKFSLENIRTVDHDEKIGKYSCSGSLVAIAGTDRQEVPIDFTSELADGGKKQYVQASELSNEDQGGLLAVLMKSK